MVPSTIRPATSRPTLVVELVGELDRPARERLEVLLDALAPMPQEVVVDLSEAYCESALALARLCRFRAARHAEGLGCRLRGLHPAVAPGWERVPLEQVFAVKPTPGPRWRAEDRQVT